MPRCYQARNIPPQTRTGRPFGTARFVTGLENTTAGSQDVALRAASPSAPPYAEPMAASLKTYFIIE